MKKAAKFTAVLLMLYFSFGVLAAPRIIRSQLNKVVSQQFSSKSAIGPITINPFLLTMSVGPSELFDPEGNQLISWRAIFADLRPWSLVNTEVELSDLRVVEPAVRLALAKDGSNNFGFLSKNDDSLEDSGASLPLIIRSFSLDQGRLVFEDSQASHKKKPFSQTFYPIELKLEDLDTRTGLSNPYLFEAVTPSGTKLKWQGIFGLDPLSAKGTLALKSLDLKRLDNYLRKFLLGKLRGEVDASLAYDFSLAKENKFIVSDLELALRSFKLDDASGGPVFHAKQLTLSDADLNILEQKAVIRSVAIVGERVNLVRLRDGNLAAANLIKSSSSSKQSKKSATEKQNAGKQKQESKTWQYQLGNIVLDGGVLRYEDLTVGTNSKSPDKGNPAIFSLGKLRVEATGISNQPGAMISIKARGANSESTALELDGELALEPFSLKAAIELSGVALALFQPYLSGEDSLVLTSGSASAKGNLSLLPGGEHGQLFQLSANGEIEGLSINLPGSENKYAAEKLAVSSLEIGDNISGVKIAKIDLVSPNIELIRTASQPAQAVKPVETEVVKKDLDSSNAGVAIGEINIAKGKLLFTDRDVKSSYHAEIDKISGSLKGLTTSGGFQSEVSLVGRLDGSAKVGISGRVTPLQKEKQTEVRITVNSYEMPELSPYAEQYLGYGLGQGALTADVQISIEGSKIKGNNKFKISNFELGEKTKSTVALSLSLPLAISLLKDSKGLIELQLPVAGNIDDPDFSYRDILFDAIGNNLLTVVKSPFSLLGALYDNTEELGYVEFMPGSSEIGENGQEKISVLQKALIERSNLQLKIKGAASVAVDSLLTKGDSDNDIESIEEAKKELKKLARSRAKAVRSAILEDDNISTERVDLIVPDVSATEVDGRVRVNLRLAAGYSVYQNSFPKK